jgi:hypothetical protein
VTITIDASVLTAYYQARAGIALSSGTGAGSSGGASGAKKNPTPPWSTLSAAPQASALTQKVLSGGRFIDEGSAKLDVPKASEDYKRLFALYQGLSALHGLTEQMQAKGLSEFRKNEIRARFDAGMKEVSAYLDDTQFDSFLLAQGKAVDKLQSSVGLPRENAAYTTGVLHTGSASDPVDAFQGPTAFSLSLKKLSGSTVQVDFDLAEMGSTPRTMANVTAYLNDKLEAAGAGSRFTVQRAEGAERTVKVGQETVKLGKGEDTYSLKFNGVETEIPTFSAAATTPAVFVGETSGEADEQLVKFATDPASGATAAVDGKVFAKSLGAEVTAVRASATAADGSLYVLADVNATTDGQTIKGLSDVALRKYDSAGNLVYSRTLGAASNAAGYALAVSADGQQVAIAGSVTGALDSGDAGADAKTADSFVAVFDSEGGQVFSQRRGATAADQVNALAFGADGTLYVAGTTSSGMGGQASLGQQDAYVQGFKANLPGSDFAYSQTFTVQYGTAGVDKVGGIAVDGSALVVAGVENGEVVARRYDLQASGAPTLSAVRDLGGLAGGAVVGVGIADDGSILVAGSTHNGALDVGAVTNAYGSGQAGFVAKLSSDLAADASERLTYYNGASDLSASAMTVSGGKVYLTGQQAVTAATSVAPATYDGFAAAIDPETGETTWSQTFRGDDRQAAPTTIAVSQTGASALDRLGLPSGTLTYAKSELLVDNTSVRAGDQFYVRVDGGVAKAVTIEADDTLKTLATKINRAAGFNAKAEVVYADGAQRLKITPATSRTPIEIEAGAASRDALKALGLDEGVVSTAKDADTKDSIKASYALEIPSTLNLGSDGYVKQAQALLLTAMSTVKSIYKDMTADPAAKAAASGAVPAYIQNQIANYQQALKRLTGGG